MSDGRTYASWQPEAVINTRIQKRENIHSNWQYRQFMTQNGNDIMKYNNTEWCYTLGLPCHKSVQTTPSNNVPHLYTSSFDTNNPGFGYNNSDLKNPYLSRQQLQSRLISPSIHLEE
jgi:hypothetical protein